MSHSWRVFLKCRLLGLSRPCRLLSTLKASLHVQLLNHYNGARHLKREPIGSARWHGLHRSVSNQTAVSGYLEVKNDHIVIHGQDEDLKVPFFWLRDNCKCSQCFHPLTKQMLHNIVDLDLNIGLLDVQCSHSEISVTWSDGHRSTYPLKWLMDHAPGVKPKPRKRTCWKGGTFNMPSFSLGSLKSEAGALRSLFQTVDEYGVSLIEGVGSSSTDELMGIANMIAGGVQSTFYTEGISVAQPGLKEADTGYTNLSLPPHTDTTYFSQPCRGMLLQVTEKTGQGGRTVLTDGFYALEQLAKEHPKMLELLSRHEIMGQYLDDDKDFQGTGPVVKINPRTNQVECLRFNLLDKAPISHIPFNELKDFYRAYQTLAKELYNEENHLKISLRPDQVVMFDNWRILHGRESFTGHRVLLTAYLRQDDWMSNMRVIGELDI